MHSYQNHQKSMFYDAKGLSNALSRIYESNARAQNFDEWPGVTNNLTYQSTADASSAKWETIFNEYRTSVAAVKTELALEPLRLAVTKIGPEMDAEFKERHSHLVDYDSYRRRIKTLEMKMETAKDNTENQKEMDKLKGKLAISQQEYTEHNRLSKEGIIDARRQHDELMDTLLITSLVCQGTLFKKMGEQIEEVIATLPKDKVDAVTDRITDYMRQGGPADTSGRGKNVKEKDKEKDKEKEKDKGKGKEKEKEKSGSSFWGNKKVDKNKESAATATAAPPNTLSSAPSAPPLPVATMVENNNPFGEPVQQTQASSSSSTSSSFAPPPPLPPPPGPPPGTVLGSGLSDVLLRVEALFDHVADDNDELNFSAGDIVEVLEKPDGEDWWKGRCRGKEGLFPTNYVKVP